MAMAKKRPEREEEAQYVNVEQTDGCGDCPQLLILRRVLQEFFKKAEQADIQWMELVKASAPRVKSIMILMDQLDCVQSVDLQSSPLASFPDVKELVGHKIKLELEEEVDSLQETLVKLQSHYVTTQKQAERVRTTYRKYSVHLNVSYLLETTPTRPAVADLLSWVDDIERYFKDEYLQLKILVGSLDYSCHSSGKELAKVWSSASDRRHISWILATVQFFVKDDLG